MERMSARGITFRYGRQTALDGVSLSLEHGEVLSLLGPNGSGKTTLLKTMLGLVKPQEGAVFLDGRDIAGLPAKKFARAVAYVPQVHRLTFAYRVLDVVIMGRLPHKPFLFRYNKGDREIAMAALEKLSIAHLSQRPYSEISGGERQLTLIARALAQEARVCVMDEPANGLDYGNQIRLLEKLNQLAESGYTFIKSTHFPDHALWVSDRVVLLKTGRVMDQGPVDRVINQDNLFKLYGCRVGVEELASGLRICAPLDMRTAKATDRRGRAWQGNQPAGLPEDRLAQRIAG